MIVDLKSFLKQERPYWDEMENHLAKLEKDGARGMDLDRLQRFHYLYSRCCADLARLQSYTREQEILGYLESLVARAYGEIHGTHEHQSRFSFLSWLGRGVPVTFRRHWRSFVLSFLTTLLGCLLGAVFLASNPSAKEILMPFPHLLVSPAERVAYEEAAPDEDLEGSQISFSAQLMTHNTRVSITTFALGLTLGIGTFTMLFYNGVILGAISWDFITGGQTRFLAGWLLPHGATEIPAILIAGQAGFVLAWALIGRGSRLSLRQRMRQIGPDLVSLMGFVALLLVWAGMVESFFSQYHEPQLPYAVKIAFGAIEIAALAAFLLRAGKKSEPTGIPEATPS